MNIPIENLVQQQKYYCPVCKTIIEKFITQNNTKQLLCSDCNSNENERLFALFIEKKYDDQFYYSTWYKMVNFSPSEPLSKLCKYRFIYNTEELSQKNTFEDKAFQDNSVDCFIFSYESYTLNHQNEILEYLFRLLKPDGWGILMLSNQNYFDEITKAGFKLTQFGKEYFGENIFKFCGISADSILNIVEKKINFQELNNIAKQYFIENNFAAAEEAYSVSYYYDMTNTEYLFNMGLSQIKQEKYSEALNSFEKLYKSTIITEEICDYLSLLYEKTGNVIKSQKVLLKKQQVIKNNLKISKNKNSLVSILIPAYNPAFFEKCLASALNQTYKNIEIIICDDSNSDELENIVKTFENSLNYEKIIYIKNPFNLRGYVNHLKCFELARGEYIKFLNDDDLLDKYCLEKMVYYFENYGQDVSLVTSKRQLIDDNGDNISDTPFSKNPFKDKTNNSFIYIEGIELANFVLSNVTNFIGEPTTVLFRKRDLEKIKPNIFSLNNKFILGPIDVTMWLNLLLKGNAVYIFEPLSFFRIHTEKFSKETDARFICTVYWFNILQEARKKGLLQDSYQYIKMIDILSSTFERGIIAENFSNEQKMELINKIDELKPLREKELNYLLERMKSLPEKKLKQEGFPTEINEPKDPMYYYMLAIEYFKLEKYNNAIELFSKSIKFGMVNFDVCNYFAICLEKIGDKKTADIFHQKAQKLKNYFS